MNFEQIQQPIWHTLDHKTTQKLWLVSMDYKTLCCAITFAIVVWCFCPHMCTFSYNFGQVVSPNILKCLVYVTPGENHSYLTIECRWHELKSIKPNLKKQPCHRKMWRIIWHMCRLVIKSTSQRWTKNNCPISDSSRVTFFWGISFSNTYSSGVQYKFAPI